MKVHELYRLAQGLSELGGKELDISTACDIAEIHDAVGSKIRPFENTRKQLIEKYSEEGTGAVRPDKVQEFQEEWSKIEERQVQIKLKKIKKSALKGIKMTPSGVSGLKPILS